MSNEKNNEIEPTVVESVEIEELTEDGGVEAGSCFGTFGTLGCPGTFGTYGCGTAPAEAAS